MVVEFFRNKLFWDTADFVSLPTNLPDGYHGQDRESGVFYFFDVANSEWKIVNAPVFDDTNLKAYWTFQDDPSGGIGTLPNLSVSAETLGTGAQGDANGFSSGDRINGVIGTAWQFGSPKHVDIGTSLSQFNFLHNQSALFTINFWLQQAVDPTGNQDVQDNNNRSSAQVGGTTFLQTGRVLRHNISVGDGNFVIGGSSGAGFLDPLDDGQFHMITITFNISPATDNMQMILDNGTPLLQTKNAFVPNNGDASQALDLGKRNSSATEFLTGALDEYSIWNRVLTAEEITSLFNNGQGRGIYT